MNWHVKKEISLANIIMVIILIIGLVTTWAQMPTQFDLEKKLDRAIYEADIGYIKNQLDYMIQRIDKLADD